MVGEPTAFPLDTAPEDDHVVGRIPSLDRLPLVFLTDDSALAHALREHVDQITGCADNEASIFNNFLTNP